MQWIACTFCGGEGEFLYWMYHRSQPPGTPEHVRTACPLCEGRCTIPDPREVESDSACPIESNHITLQS